MVSVGPLLGSRYAISRWGVEFRTQDEAEAFAAGGLPPCLMTARNNLLRTVVEEADEAVIQAHGAELSEALKNGFARMWNEYFFAHAQDYVNFVNEADTALDVGCALARAETCETRSSDPREDSYCLDATA